MPRLADSRLYLTAATQALKAFPIDAARVEPLAFGENAVFRVVDRRDVSFVLRLHRPGYHTLEELNSERSWTAALNDAGVRAPCGVRSADENWYVRVPTPDPQGFRFAGVAAWSEGEIFSDVIARDGDSAASGHYVRLGAFVARLHNQAARWSPPSSFSRHCLDLEGLVGEAPFWGRFWESALLSSQERRLAATARRHIAETLLTMPRGGDCFSMIHADLHPGNVLIEAGRFRVIDFDDAAFGWHAYDIAVALFDAWARTDYPSLRDGFLQSYGRVRPGTGNLADVLPHFLLLRGLMHIGWLEQRPELDPGPFMGNWRARLMSECNELLSD